MTLPALALQGWAAPLGMGSMEAKMDDKVQKLMEAGRLALDNMAKAFPITPAPARVRHGVDGVIQNVADLLQQLEPAIGPAGLLAAVSMAFDKMTDAREQAEAFDPGMYASSFLSDLRWAATELDRIKDAAEHLTPKEAKDTMPVPQDDDAEGEEG